MLIESDNVIAILERQPLFADIFGLNEWCKVVLEKS